MSIGKFVNGFTDDGAEVWVRHLPHIPWVIGAALVYAGRRQEPPGPPGLAHCAEHAIADAAGTIGDLRGKLTYLAENRLIPLQTAATDTESVFSALKGPRASVRKMLEFWNVLFREEPCEFDVEKQKTIMIREFRENHGHADAQAWRQALFLPMLPDGHPAMRSEHPQTIERLTRDDVIAFWRRWFGVRNMIFFFSGGMTLPQAVAELQAVFRPRAQDRLIARANVAPFREQRQPIRRRLRVADALGHAEYARYDPLIRLDHVTPPGTVSTAERLLLEATIRDTCFFSWREELRIIYGIETEFVRHRDCEVFEVSLSSEEGRLGEAEELVETLPALVRERGAEYFALAKRIGALNVGLSDDTVWDDVRGAMDLIAKAGFDYSADELLAELEAVTFERVVELVETLYAPGRCFTTTVLY